MSEEEVVPSKEKTSLRREVKRAFKDTSIYGLGSVLPKAAAFFLAPIYTAYMSRAQYGIYGTVTTASLMISIFMTMGQNGSMVLFYRSTAEHAEERRETFFTVFWFVMIFGALLLGLGFIFGPAHARTIIGSKGVPFNPYIALALLIAFISIPQAFQQAINRAQGQAKLFTAFQLATFAINTGFTLYFIVALHQGAYGSLKGTLFAAVIVLPAVMVVLVRRWKPRISLSGLKRSLRFGLPLIPHNIASWALTFIDRYLLARMTTMSQVGLYTVAYNICLALNLFCSTINLAWAPIYYDLSESESGRRTLPRLTTVYAATVAILSIGFTLLGPELLILITARSYHAAAPVVPVVAGGYFFFGMYMVVSTPIFHARKTSWVPLISAAAAVLNVDMNLALIPYYGIMAAAWATLVAYGFMAAIAYCLANKLRPGVFEHSKLAVLVGIYAISLTTSIALVEIRLPLWMDIAIKLAVVLFLFWLMLVFRLASIAELRSFIERRHRRTPITEESEEELAVEQTRLAEEIGDSVNGSSMPPEN